MFLAKKQAHTGIDSDNRPAVRAKSASSFTEADVALVCSYEGLPDGMCLMTCTGVNGNQSNNDEDLRRLNSQAGGWQLCALPANA